MASKIEVYGKVNHYATQDGVIFSLVTYDPKKKDSTDSPMISEFNYNIPFEIWSKYKDKNVKITIEQVD